MENNETFHHALYVDHDLCIRCTHCIKECPTEAMRIVNSQVVIREERCIDCGECMRVCPHKAIKIEDDDLALMHNYKYRVALFPAVFIGQFPKKITEDQIYSSILKLGFTHAYEVEQPIGVLRNMLRETIRNKDSELPLISSFCPAVVRLIRIRYPDMTDQLVHLKAPHDLAAHWVLQQFKEQGIPREEVGLFYVTPCAAKVAAVKSPLGETESIINGVINSKVLYNKVMAIAENVEQTDTSKLRSEITKQGIQWSLTRGETSSLPGQNIAVDGIHNVIRFLERLENDEVPDLDFLELRACDRSCAAGILLAQNRFLTVERLKERARRYPYVEKIIRPDKGESLKVLEPKMITDEIKPRPMLRYGKDTTKAMERMQKARNIMCFLPGIDCAACGAPTCMALAEDMVNGQARMSDCIFIQQMWQKQAKVDPEIAFDRMENKWGRNRFDPDCTKKGAKNEGF